MKKKATYSKHTVHRNKLDMHQQPVRCNYLADS
jgi:hypothetical protein